MTKRIDALIEQRAAHQAEARPGHVAPRRREAAVEADQSAAVLLRDAHERLRIVEAAHVSGRGDDGGEQVVRIALGDIRRPDAELALSRL